ncbi:MAG: GNAT family N-acetyltransferase [Planctomycetota bacterium]|jgi:putative acetyltransferase
MMYIVRREQPRDVPKIREVNKRAFGQDQEASIVDRLGENCNSILSLVALAGREVVGHILFSPAAIEGENGRLVGSGLAPLAVLPEYQRRGIGSELVQTGVGRIREGGCPYIIVLGHPEYYARSDSWGPFCTCPVSNLLIMVHVISRFVRSVWPG